MLQKPEKQRKAGQGQRTAQERPVRRRQRVAQAAEPPHVDHVAHRVHDAAGGQEEQGLEEGVREQVKHGGHDRHRDQRARAHAGAVALPSARNM